MTELHQFVAIAAVAGTVGLLGAAAWSFAAARRSGGLRDHRFAVDRLILVTMGSIALAGCIGGGLLVGGRQPADALHLLYGPAAFVAPVLAWWYGGRAAAGSGAAAGSRAATETGHGTSPGSVPHRSRRDAWIIVAAIILLGIELRLFVTG